MDVSENRGKTPKMDGENNGKPSFLMDFFGGKTYHLRKHPFVWGKEIKPSTSTTWDVFETLKKMWFHVNLPGGGSTYNTRKPWF